MSELFLIAPENELIVEAHSQRQKKSLLAFSVTLDKINVALTEKNCTFNNAVLFFHLNCLHWTDYDHGLCDSSAEATQEAPLAV